MSVDPNDLINSVNNAAEDVKFAATASTSAEVTNEEEVKRKRKELLLLVGTEEMKKSEAYLNKATAKVILKVYAEYEAAIHDRNTIFLCDLFLSKFSMLLGGLDAVEKPDAMEAELTRDPLLQRDLKRSMAWLTPMIPFLGLLSGGLTVGKHVFKHSKKSDDNDDVQDTPL